MIWKKGLQVRIDVFGAMILLHLGHSSNKAFLTSKLKPFKVGYPILIWV